MLYYILKYKIDINKLFDSKHNNTSQEEKNVY